MVIMDREIIIEKIVHLLRNDDLLYKSVVGYINAARKDCLVDKDGTDSSPVAKYKEKA